MSGAFAVQKTSKAERRKVSFVRFGVLKPEEIVTTRHGARRLRAVDPCRRCSRVARAPHGLLTVSAARAARRIVLA